MVKPSMLSPSWVFRIGAIGFSIAGSLILASGACAQAVFNVNTTDDGVDANVVDGKCEIAPPAPAGTCTLRAAVMQSNRIPNAGATIKLPAGTYNLTIPATIAGGEENGDLNLLVPADYAPGPTTIIGDGAGITIIDANAIDRVLHIDAGRSATISGISLVNGLLSGSNFGGGIYNQGSLALSDCILSHNIVSYGNGGGIFNQGSLVATRIGLNANTAQSYGGGIYNLDHLELSQSSLNGNKAIEGAGIYSASNSFPYSRVDFTQITGNMASIAGGGIANIYSADSLIITHSAVSGNTAGNHGGGVYNEGLLYASNSTISGNFAKKDGGGIYNQGTGEVYNSTVAYNQADTDADGIGDGGGVFNVADKTFDVHNTILAGNLLDFDNSNSDCAGFIGLYGVTGFEGGIQCFGFGAVILIDSSKELGILKNNGGTTDTIALLPGSNLVGNGAADECKDDAGHYLTSDQRGNPRPPGGTACDIGAFEYNEVFRSGF